MTTDPKCDICGQHWHRGKEHCIVAQARAINRLASEVATLRAFVEMVADAHQQSEIHAFANRTLRELARDARAALGEVPK